MVIKHHCEDFRSYPASVTPVTSHCHKNVTFSKNGANRPKTWTSIKIALSSVPTKFGDNLTTLRPLPDHHKKVESFNKFENYGVYHIR